MQLPSNLKTFQSLADLHSTVTGAVCDLIEQAVRERCVCRISLSGGSTPRRLYEMLADRDLPWNAIHWYWGDERNVPHDHAESNYKMVREAMLDKVGAPAENIHAVPVNTLNPEEAATEYERLLRSHFGDDHLEGPKWDLVLLGMGDDAHTASLFPHTSGLDLNDHWFVENWVEKFNAFRYTLTAPAINSGREIWFLLAGASKREALSHVWGETQRPAEYPSQLIRPTRWFVTQDALPSD